MRHDAPARSLTRGPFATLVALFGMLGLCVRIDRRRPASWVALAMTVAAAFLPWVVESEQVLITAWASGVAAAAVALGDRPRTQWWPGRRCPARSGPRCGAGGDLLQALARLGWPLSGAVSAWLMMQASGMRPSGGPWAAAAGLGMAGVVLLAIAWVGGAAADAAATVFFAAVLVAATAWGHPWLLAGVWGMAAVVAIGMVSRVDRGVSLAREALVAGVPPGSSEVRRWLLRGVMVAMLAAMLRWLLVDDPRVERYGLMAILASAGLILPETLLRDRITGERLAFAAPQRWTRWRRLAPQAMPAVIALWPLLVACLVAPPVRGTATVAVGMGFGLAPAVAALLAAAVKGGWFGRETAFAIGVALVGLAVVALWAWGTGQTGGVSAAFPWDS